MFLFYLLFALSIKLSHSQLAIEDKQQCIYSLQDSIYDLSSLSNNNGYWMYSHKNYIIKNKTDHYFISICKPIKNLTNCDSNVCFNSEFNKVTNSEFLSGGKTTPESVPTLLNDGRIIFNFVNGSQCRSRNIMVPYMTEVHLQCPLDSEESSYGPVLISDKGCRLVFVWITKAACPKPFKIKEDHCILHIDESKTVDLNQLTKETFYVANDNINSFEVNICGPIINGSCPQSNVTICDITNKLSPKPIAYTNHNNLEWNKHGNIDMVFENGNTTSKIEFNCHQLRKEPLIQLANNATFNDKIQINIEVETNLICPLRETDCILRNRDKGYIDLRPLRNAQSNWEVFIEGGNNTDELYLLNVCGPINNNDVNGCPDGPVGACKASASDGGSLNLGYVSNPPVWKDDGTVVITYTGGDICKNSNMPITTEIWLFCSQKEHLPKLSVITPSCEYIFEWETPSACPRKDIKGEGCIVKDSVHGEVFDLNPLRNLSKDYFIHSEETHFEINVCGPLLTDCNGSNSSVCNVTKDAKMSGGKAPGTLLFTDGTLVFQFEDGADCKDGKWSTEIILICSHTGHDTIPQYFNSNHAICSHYFIWPTIYACPSFTSIDCFVEDGKNLYDLTPLSYPTENWIPLKKPSNSQGDYVFNICRSVIHDKYNRCPYKAGSCLIDPSKQNTNPISLGNVVASPFIKNGTLMIHYTGGDFCTKKKRYETLLVFECVRNQYESIPILMEDTDCRIVIKIQTADACPHKLYYEAPVPGTICSITNPITKYNYDLYSLTSLAPQNITFNNETVFLNVCAEVSNRKCFDERNAGSCIIRERPNGTEVVNFGVANDDLQFSKWTIYLEYKDGDLCYTKGNKSVYKSTHISFVCSEGNLRSGPSFVDYDKTTCTLFVFWHTELACERRIRCNAKAHDGRIVDLSPFVLQLDNYIVKDPQQSNITYYINVCQPLHPIEGVRCAAGATACMAIADGNSTDARSLGHPLTSPVFVRDDSIAMMYSHGSKCPTDDKLLLTSRITFICNRTIGVGYPVYAGQTQDCQVQFEWHSTMVCPFDHQIDVNNNDINSCQIYHEQAKANVDISKLFRKNGYLAQKIFKINVCGSVCNGSGVCTEDGTSYGNSKDRSLTWEDKMLKMTYFSGSPCRKSLVGSRSSVIYFECDMKSGFGSPVLEPWVHEDACSVVFTWKTNVTCLESIYRTKEIPKATTLTPNVSSTQNTIPTSTIDINATAVLTQKESSGRSGFSIFIIVALCLLIFGIPSFVFLRTIRGRRLSAQAKGFFRKQGDEVFMLDDEYLRC